MKLRRLILFSAGYIVGGLLFVITLPWHLVTSLRPRDDSEQGSARVTVE